MGRLLGPRLVDQLLRQQLDDIQRIVAAWRQTLGNTAEPIEDAQRNPSRPKCGQPPPCREPKPGPQRPTRPLSSPAKADLRNVRLLVLIPNVLLGGLGCRIGPDQLYPAGDRSGVIATGVDAVGGWPRGTLRLERLRVG